MWITLFGTMEYVSYLGDLMTLSKFKAQTLTKMMTKETFIVEYSNYIMHCRVKKVQPPFSDSIYGTYHCDVMVEKVYKKQVRRDPESREFIRDDRGCLTYDPIECKKPPRYSINSLNKYIRYNVRKEMSLYSGFVCIQNWCLDGGKVYWPK